MWLCLNDCFLSIVSKDCARDELLVRARRKGDIEKVFPEAAVRRDARADYLFRAVVKRREIANALAGEVQRIAYGNFKDSVDDGNAAGRRLHDAYMRVWSAMATLQPKPRGKRNLFDFIRCTNPPSDGVKFSPAELLDDDPWR